MTKHVGSRPALLFPCRPRRAHLAPSTSTLLLRARDAPGVRIFAFTSRRSGRRAGRPDRCHAGRADGQAWAFDSTGGDAIPARRQQDATARLPRRCPGWQATRRRYCRVLHCTQGYDRGRRCAMIRSRRRRTGCRSGRRFCSDGGCSRRCRCRSSRRSCSGPRCAGPTRRARLTGVAGAAWVGRPV